MIVPPKAERILLTVGEARRRLRPGAVGADAALDRQRWCGREIAGEAGKPSDRRNGRADGALRMRNGSGKAAGSGQDIGGEAAPGVEDLCHGGGFRFGLPWLGRHNRGVGVEIEHHAKQLDAGDAVDHAVMDLEHERPLAALEALHEPRFPQRAVTVERLGHDPPHQAAERGVVTGCRQGGVPQVVGEVEVRIVYPDRSTQLEGNRPHPLAVAGDHVELGGDHRGDFVERRRWVAKDADGPDVHMRDPVLQVEELGIERAHSLHRCPPCVTN